MRIKIILCICLADAVTSSSDPKGPFYMWRSPQDANLSKVNATFCNSMLNLQIGVCIRL